MDSNQMKMYTPDTNSFKMKDKNQHIQVFARVRPMNGQERAKNSLTVLDCPGSKEVVVKERTSSSVTKTFTFDKVFGPNSKQIEVYKSVVAPLLEEVLLGYNCTVFAYGQTGTGKTFTMEGDRQFDSTLGWDKDPMSGIVPRALNQLFDELRMQKAEFTVRVSLLELYNEELFDLLASTEDMKLKNLRLYEDNTRKGSVVIQGLEEVTVHDKHEVYAIMERGALKRQTAATLMNEKSSRSHTVFTVTVHIKESNMDGEELLKIGKLHLVDLAGSENIGRSGAVDKRAREAGSINQSLLTLGRVITALVERTPHVPYRESKLTRILQDSLGGRTKTSIIATVSPASINIEETLSTLDYAHRAKNITNRPEINQKLTKKAILKAYTEEIEQLKKDLQATREKNGIFIDKSNYERMTSQIEAQGQDISERIALIKSLEETVEKKEEEQESMKAMLTEKEERLVLADAVIEKLKLDLRRTEAELRLTRLQRDEKDHLLSKHVETEIKLSTEAGTLLETANTTTVNLESLYSKLERKRRVEESNLAAGKRFRGDVVEDLMASIENLVAFRAEHAKFCGEHRLSLGDFLQNKNVAFEEMRNILIGLSEDGAVRLTTLTKLVDSHRDTIKAWDQNMETATDVKVSHLNELFEDAIKVCKEYHDQISVNIAVMMQSFGILYSDTHAYTEKVYTSTQTILSQHTEVIDMVLFEVSEFVQVHDKDMEILQNEVNTFVAAGGNHGRKVDEEIKKIEKRLHAIKVSQKGMYKTIEDQNVSLTTNIKNCFRDARYFAVNLNNMIHDVRISDIDTRSSLVVPTAEIRAKMDAGRKRYLQLTFDTQGLVAKQRDNTISKFAGVQNVHEIWDNTLQSIRKEAIDNADHFNLSLDAHTQSVKSTIQQKGHELETERLSCLNEDLSMVAKLEDDIQRECQWASDWSDVQSNAVTRQLGMIGEFFDSTYLVDLPSGATPQRKVYEYPTKLSMTSPHESILGRFRKQRVSPSHATSGNLVYQDIEEDLESCDGSYTVRISSGADSDSSSNECNMNGNGQTDATSEAVSKDIPTQAVAGEKVLELSKGSNKENSAATSKTGKLKVNASRQGAPKEQLTKSKDILKSKNVTK